MVVLPAPEGAETMNRRPRRRPGASVTRAAGGSDSLDTLDLLAHLLELRLGGDDQLRDAQAVGLRPHRVDLAVHLLQQEIELAAAGLGAVGEGDPVRDMPAEPGDFLTDVGARGGTDDLLG